ncbi:hypothetical protein EJB05_31286, partial [Eragrostis curvula]
MGRGNPCCSEEKKLRKGLWSPEEDERLASHIARFGVSCWSSIPELAGDALQPPPAVFNPTCSAAVSSSFGDSSAASSAVVDATQATSPLPAAPSASSTEAARRCEDDFLRAMVDDASYLLGDFYLDGSQDGLISFWEGHSFS